MMGAVENMTMDIKTLSHMSLRELQAAYADKCLSPVEVIHVTLAQNDAVGNKINALYGVRDREARAEANASQERYAAGKPLSAFDGVPVTLKDSVNAIGMYWHHGSAIHGEGVIGTIDSPPAARLKKAGAIILGKTIMPDFGLSASGVSTSHGIVHNPWGLSWSTGGSSAGGAASIATGIGMMSVGSDIAGSVRLPASHCGLAAFKPTQGIIPHAPASNVRSAGPITRRAADLEAWTKLLTGPDTADRYSMRYCDANRDRKLSVGATADFGFGPSTEPAVKACFENVKAALEELVGNIQCVSKTPGFNAYLPIDDSLKLRGWAEYSSASDELRDLVPQALYAWFREAEDWGGAKIREVECGIEKSIAYCVDLLADVDVLLTPVMPVVNFPVEDLGVDPLMPLRHTTFTALFNQSGNPAVSICGGFDDRGLPIGMQLVAKRLDDAALLKLATDLELKLNIFGDGKRDWPVTPMA
tara:strand:+ start:126956 stop:128374 length:1419 start_codon:yes stop_codon:yes gene_type:complete